MASRIRVLLVDDESDIIESVKAGLEVDGFLVSAYNDPEVALNEFKPNYFDFAIIDVRMPKMNGFQLYRELLSRDGNLRVAFFSAFDNYRDEMRKAFPELDEASFIRKPSTLAHIKDKIFRETGRVAHTLA